MKIVAVADTAYFSWCVLWYCYYISEPGFDTAQAVMPG